MSWQPIETYPKELVREGKYGIRALFYAEDGNIYTGNWWKAEDDPKTRWQNFLVEPGSFAIRPTHWMPLPEPPVQP